MLYYKKYIIDRLSKTHHSVSEIERYASYAVNKHSGSNDFRVLVFLDNEYYDCLCAIDNQKRFMIESMRCKEHNLRKIYNRDVACNTNAKKYELAYFEHNGHIDYDEYYNANFEEIADYNRNVKEALGDIDCKSSPTTYMVGDFIHYKAVKYNIECKVGNAIWIDSQENTNITPKILFSPALMSEKIHINVKGASMIDLIRQKAIDVYIPNHADSLNSRLTGSTTWSDIIPKNCVKCSIGNTECYYLTMSLEADAFNNLFCVTADASGNKKTTLIYSRMPVTYRRQT